MTERERLIELIRETPNVRVWPEANIKIADHLIANGVTVPKHGRWLPQILLGQRVWGCSECATIGSPHWKLCPVCEAKMDLPKITPTTEEALFRIGQQAHGE